MNNAKLLLRIGSNLYKYTKSFILYAPIGLLGLLITFLLCDEHSFQSFTLNGSIEIVNYIVGVLYIMVAIGCIAIIPYFMGLVLIGLGQIAENTCRKPSSTSPIVFPATNKKDTPPGNWRCSSCGKENSNNNSCCDGCGMYK